jgi:hypothetical protein
MQPRHALDGPCATEHPPGALACPSSSSCSSSCSSSSCGGEVHDLLLVASERVHHKRGQAHGKQQAEGDARRLRVAGQREEWRACEHMHT